MLQPWTCSSLVGPTAELFSARPGAPRTLLNCDIRDIRNQLLRNLVEAPTADTPYADWWLFQSRLMGVRWVHDGVRFYSTAGALWRPVDNTEVKNNFTALARATFLPLLDSVVAAPDDTVIPARKAVVNGLRTCRTHVFTDACIRHFLESAKTECFDATFRTRVDACAHHLGTPGGVLDLRTAQLLPESAPSAVSISVAVPYAGEDAPTPVVDDFMRAVFDADEELIAYVQRWLGYCLTGENTAQRFAVYTGNGSNGKSRLNEWMAALLGDYAIQANPYIFFAKSESTSTSTPYLAELHHKRYAFVDESSSQDVVNLALLKGITGGQQLNVKKLYQDPFVMPITHKQVLATNDIPRLDLLEYSMERRIVIIPFNMQFLPPGKLDPANPRHRPQDEDLLLLLKTEDALQQLLTWLVRGARAYYAHSGCFSEKPAAVKAVEASYISDMDVFGAFLEAHTTRTDDGFLVEKELSERLRLDNIRVVVKRQMLLRNFVQSKKKVEGKVVWGYKGIAWGPP